MFLNSALVFFVSFFFISTSHADSLVISPKVRMAPAIDLLEKERPIDRDRAIDLEDSGKDISLLNPATTDIWKPEKFTASNAHELGYPNPSHATVTFSEHLQSATHLFRSLVTTPGVAGPKVWRLVMTLEVHAALARAALYRKLGYPVASPQYYEKLTVRFPSVDTKNKFLDRLSNETQTSRDRWIVSNPDDGLEVAFRGVALEPATADVPAFYWAEIPNGLLQGRRSLRATLLPLVLIGLEENVNLFSWDVGTKNGHAVILTHRSAKAYAGELTFPDSKWVARKIVELDLKELEEVVAEGRFPHDIGLLVLQKVISRRNQLVSLFKLKNDLPKKKREYPFETKLNVGTVKGGKATLEEYPGYVARFTWGNPESPLNRGEIEKYLLLELIGAGTQKLSSEITKLMTIRGIEDVVQSEQQKLQKEFMDWLSSNPTKPFDQSIKPWGGVIGGLGLDFQRSVVTGTYYGSDSKVQLVDTIAGRATIGYFMGLRNVDTRFIPGFQGNLSIQRNYTHVRPISKIQEALKTNWAWIAVPTYLNHLSEFLDEEYEDAKENLDANGNVTLEPRVVSEEELKAKEVKYADLFNRFTKELSDGEIFTITDSLVGGVGASVNIPITALLGLDPIGFANSLVLGGNTRGVIMRRTTFVKTEKGIQVYLQRMNVGAVEFTFDFNYWMNIFKASREWKTGTAKTKAFTINTQAVDEDTSRKLVFSMRALLKHHNTEVIESNFGHYKLDHDLDAVIDRAKLLFWRWFGVEETHKVKVQLPPDTQVPPRYNPEDTARTLMSHRMMDMKGKNYQGLIADIISAAIPEINYSPSSAGDYPSSSFLGSGRWVTVSTEAEVTPGRESDFVTMIEDHWSGWILSKARFFKLLDQIERRAASFNLDRGLVRREEFEVMKSLHLYDIDTTLIINGKGLARMKAILFHPDGFWTTYATLLSAEDPAEFANWCRQQKIRSYWTPKIQGDIDPTIGYISKEANGERIRIDCVKPWMRTVLKLRKDNPRDIEEKLRWSTRLFSNLAKSVRMDKLAEWLGDDGYYFKVGVNGFRSGDEGAELKYISDSLGTYNIEDSQSIFEAFSHEHNIQMHELQARYLSEGF